MIVAFHHPGFEAPIGRHIMPIRKFALVAEALRREPRVQLREPAPATEADLSRVHTPDYLRAVQTGEPRALAESQRFPWSAQLYPSVRLTSGACIAAASQALDDGVAAAVASGFHHAHADHGEGFCTFNGLVVAIDTLRHARRLQRAAVLDLDLHYGNGTASLAVPRREYLFALSIYGNDYRENKPYRDVTVRQHEDGPNHRSVALPAGCNGTMLLDILDRSLPMLLDDKPDLLLYQAGADPYREDPYSPLDLGHEDLLERDRRVFEFARAQGLPIAWVLAGGYTEDVSKVVRVHTNTFQAALNVFASR